MTLSVSAAFRAILAEPRTKNAIADNDYFSNPRTEHSGNDPGSNSYTFGKYQATSTWFPLMLLFENDIAVFGCLRIYLDNGMVSCSTRVQQLRHGGHVEL